MPKQLASTVESGATSAFTVHLCVYALVCLGVLLVNHLHRSSRTPHWTK